MVKEFQNRKYLSVSEYAKILGISRIAVYKRIKSGKLKVVKIGKNYAVPAEYLTNVSSKRLTQEDKVKIDEAVEKTFQEYGELLKILGNE